jgi:uncharacterized protein (DUF1800 family)
MNGFRDMRRPLPPCGVERAAAIVAALMLLAGNEVSPANAASPAARKPPSKNVPAVAAAKPAPRPAVGGPAFVDNTPLTQEQRIVHALNRLGFGPRPGDVERVQQMGLGAYIARQLSPEKVDDTRLEAKLAALGFDLLAKSPQELMAAYYNGLRTGLELKKLRDAQSGGSGSQNGTMEATPPAMSRAEDQQRLRMLVQRQQREGAQRLLFELRADKVIRAAESERQLNEVLVDFWSNHFNIDIRKNQCRFLKAVDERDVIRPHVLGKFRDLLGASAKSPAMLVYLDNFQSQVPQPINRRREAAFRNFVNKRGGPLAKTAVAMSAPAPGQRTRGGINENYAREIMELHTLGVDGGYTQKDVQEVARCLTGWSVNRQTGTFVFNRRGHDTGEKIVLGQRLPAGGGMEDGERVLDILARIRPRRAYVA